MPGPLASLKVLDFSTLLPGPFASMILAALGAEILRVEAPNRPDMVREMSQRAGPVSAAHAMLNRSKRFIALDLKNPAPEEVLEELLGRYDILLEQYRPAICAQGPTSAAAGWVQQAQRAVPTQSAALAICAAPAGQTKSAQAEKSET